MITSKLNVFCLLSEKKMFRGCFSDTTEARMLCGRIDLHEHGTCIRCSSDGCNDQQKFLKPELSCVNCKDSDECAYGQNSADAIPCTKDIVLGDQETCFTHSISSMSYLI